MSPEESSDSERRGRILIDGPNVMLTIRDIWRDNSPTPDLWYDNLPNYEVIANWLQDYYETRAENFDKYFFLKYPKDVDDISQKAERQAGFVKALTMLGWKVIVRHPAEGTEYGDKQNDIDDDLIEDAEDFLTDSKRKPGDVLIVMSNDFNVTPSGRSFLQTLIDARDVGLKSGYVAFQERISRNVLTTSGLTFFDSRYMEGVYQSAPPLREKHNSSVYGRQGSAAVSRLRTAAFAGRSISTEATTLLPPPIARDDI